MEAGDDGDCTLLAAALKALEAMVSALTEMEAVLE